MTIILALLFSAQMQATHTERYEVNYVAPMVSVQTVTVDDTGIVSLRRE